MSCTRIHAYTDTQTHTHKHWIPDCRLSMLFWSFLFCMCCFVFCRWCLNFIALQLEAPFGGRLAEADSNSEVSIIHGPCPGLPSLVSLFNDLFADGSESTLHCCQMSRMTYPWIQWFWTGITAGDLNVALFLKCRTQVSILSVLGWTCAWFRKVCAHYCPQDRSVHLLLNLTLQLTIGTDKGDWQAT